MPGPGRQGRRGGGHRWQEQRPCVCTARSGKSRGESPLCFLAHGGCEPGAASLRAVTLPRGSISVFPCRRGSQLMGVFSRGCSLPPNATLVVSRMASVPVFNKRAREFVGFLFFFFYRSASKKWGHRAGCAHGSGVMMAKRVSCKVCTSFEQQGASWQGKGPRHVCQDSNVGLQWGEVSGEASTHLC